MKYETSETQWSDTVESNANMTTGAIAVPKQIDKLIVPKMDEESVREEEPVIKLKVKD